LVTSTSLAALVSVTRDQQDKRGSYTIPKSDEYYVLRFPQLHHSLRGYGTGMLRKEGVSGYITSNAKPLANKLRMSLQTRSRDRYEYGQRRGKLHNGSLHRLMHEDKAKVFRKRVVSDTLDTAVCLLVDCSGSMSGYKFDMACCGAGALAEALKPLNIPFTTLGFTNHADKKDAPMIWVFNDFGERVNSTELVNRFAIASGVLWENTDGDAIVYAHAQLAKRKEKRKVLIVLSDGMPAGRTWAGDAQSYTKDVISNAEKQE
jgi:cobalamin biosynthesis protein CobT